MAQWVLWDNEKDEYRGWVRQLPAQLEGRDIPYLNLLGYHEVRVIPPEDAIQRFPALLGSAKFTRLPSGTVTQTFPDADFSVAAVRKELLRNAKLDAGRELGRTDWYIVRKTELGTEIPDEVVALRQKIRDHLSWIEADLAKTAPRDLVDYQWFFPVSAEQEMVDGHPVIVEPTRTSPVAEENLPTSAPVNNPTPPAPLEPPSDEELNPPPPPIPAPPDENPPPPPPVPEHPDHVLNPPPPPEPDNPKPPPSTDGPVPIVAQGEELRLLDDNGLPVVSVYGYENVPGYDTDKE